MEVNSTYDFKASPEFLWDKLLEPGILAGCIPGCREFKIAAQDQYDVVLAVKVGPITGNYTGKVTIIDKDHLRSFKMLVEGKGRGGSLRGEGVLSLHKRDGMTDLTVHGDAQVSGVLARMGQRLMGSASRMMMDQFFACLKGKIEEEQ